MDILKTVNLKKYYGSGANLVKALDGVNLTVEEGEFLAVVGTRLRQEHAAAYARRVGLRNVGGGHRFR